MTFSQIPLAQQDFQNTVGFLKQVWVFFVCWPLKDKNDHDFDFNRLSFMSTNNKGLPIFLCVEKKF